MYSEKKRRSLIKAISWRVLATLTTILIVFILTKEIVLAAAIGGIEVVAKMVLYFFHERVWNRVGFGRKEIKPFVLWFTGLSGAGKSTLADKVYEDLKRRGCRVERLDGDVVRTMFPNTGFSKEERDKHIRRVGLLAQTLERNGVIVIASFISPYQETRDFVRGLCHNFVEVYVKASLETCEKRDVKGLYKKARAGEITQFTGIDDPYEVPQNPEIVIDTNKETLQQSTQNLLNKMKKLLT